MNKRKAHERWAAKVVARSVDDCWIWQAHTDRAGYGSFWADGRVVQAHRWAYELWVGPVPKWFRLNHLCGVKTCVNPAHLEPVKRREKTIVSDAVCTGCGNTFQRTRSDQKSCSEACRKRHRTNRWATYTPPTDQHTCLHCGATFTAKRDRRRSGYCTNRCSINARFQAPGEFAEQKPDALMVWFRDCRECGELFTTRHATSKTCGIDCRRAWNLRIANERGTELYRLATTLDGKGKMWRQVLLDALVHRDGPDCGICGEPVDLEVKSGPSGDGRGHSFDHVIPRSLGGPDTLDNLRLTHWECNHLRFAKPAPGEAFVYTLDGTVSEVIAIAGSRQGEVIAVAGSRQAAVGSTNGKPRVITNRKAQLECAEHPDSAITTYAPSTAWCHCSKPMQPAAAA